MTARADLLPEPFDLLFVERELESYAETTRIVASDQFRDRVRVRLAEEPRATPWLRAWRSIRTVARVAFGREPVTTAARLQAFVLLLVCALALAAAAGGAGAVLVQRLSGPTENPRQSTQQTIVLPLPSDPPRPKTTSAPSPVSRTPLHSATAGVGKAAARTGSPKRSHGAARRHGRSDSTPAPRKSPKARPRHTPTPTMIPSPQPSPSPSDDGGGSVPPSPTVPATPASSPSPPPTGTPEATPTPPPDPTPEATPTPPPDPTPEATATPPATERTPSPSDEVAKPTIETPTADPTSEQTPEPG